MDILNKILYLLLVTIMCCLVSFSSCNGNPEPATDLVGTFTWTEWQKKSGWKDHSASDYIPDTACANKLQEGIKSNSGNVRFELYISNWCTKDCEPQVPRVIKFLKAAGVNESDIIIYGIDRSRTEPQDAMLKWNNAFPNEICRLPSLVIYLNNNILKKVKCETDDYPEWQCKIEVPILMIE